MQCLILWTMTFYWKCYKLDLEWMGIFTLVWDLPQTQELPCQCTRQKIKCQDLDFSVVQGSGLGPVLYNSYAHILETVVSNDLDQNGFADNCRLNEGFDPNEELTVKSDMEHCLDDINSWMSNNRLKMKSLKTEFIHFRSQQQAARHECNCINASG